MERLTPQHIELVSQDQDFSLQRHLSLLKITSAHIDDEVLTKGSSAIIAPTLDNTPLINTD
jgi:hypothetical protein